MASKDVAMSMLTGDEVTETPLEKAAAAVVVAETDAQNAMMIQAFAAAIDGSQEASGVLHLHVLAFGAAVEMSEACVPPVAAVAASGLALPRRVAKKN